MPRLGLGSIDLSATTGGGNSVTTIDDFFFESFSAGQMHPILTTSRTNLVLQSETWNNASWTKNASTVEANQIASPLNLSAFTADLLKEDNANAEHWVRSNNITASLGQTFTMSFYAKAKERTFIKANFLNSGVVSYNVWINLSNGAITSKNDNLTVTTELIGSGFYRITLTAQAAATTLNLLVALATGDANDSYAGDGSSGAYVFGAQVEQDNFVSNYIPTVGSTVTVSTTLNDTSEVWDFDGTDIEITEDPEDEGFWEESYPDGATLPELVLNGDYEELGSELANFSDSNISFGNSSDSTTISLSANSYRSEAFGNTGDDRPRVTINGSGIVTGKTYEVTYTPTSFTGSTVFDFFQNNTRIINNHDASIAKTFYFVASSSLDAFVFDGSDTFRSDYTLSVKQVDPNDRWGLSNTTISNGALTFTDNSSAAQYAFQDNVVEVGNSYEVTLTVNRTSGTLQVLFGTGGSGVSGVSSITASGTYTFRTSPLTSVEAGSGRFWAGYTSASDNFIGTVDNVRVKEYAIQPLDI